MILQEIADKTKIRVAKAKEILPLEQIKAQALALNCDTGFPFEKALRCNDIAFICEVKKASPSKGLIAEDFPYLKIAKEYEQGGAAAISILTEPEYFLGNNDYLKEIAASVNIPILRKDFTIDEYMIYEAKILGASGVLLICSLLDDETLRRYLDITESLGLSALVEAHSEDEIAMAIRAGAKIIGVNNRDLKTFTVDVNNARRLRPLVPSDIIYISESGIKTPEDIEKLRQFKADGVLIGETLMREANKAEAIRRLKGREK